MNTVYSIRELNEITDPLRQDAQATIGFVPTLGALHEGHCALIQKAAQECTFVVVSVFVNPTQFNDPSDYQNYPRNPELDAEKATAAGAHIVWMPTVEDMYPSQDTTITVGGLASLWEGAHRPGHFDGVATIVAKLFNIVRPDTAYFGLKDLQQCAVISQMKRDLHFPLELKFINTIREPDGLALSSRNQRLSSQERAVAPALYRELRRCATLFLSEPLNVDAELQKSIAALTGDGFSVEYFALVDTQTFQMKEAANQGDSIIVAARLGVVRLIDNVQIGSFSVDE